jgi:PAS domain S-box-containing protein
MALTEETPMTDVAFGAAAPPRRTSPGGSVVALKSAVQALHNSEPHFRQLLEALPAAVYTTDAAGRITFYNEAAVALAGRRPELGTDHWCVTWRLYWPDGTPMRHDECPMAIALREGRAIRGAEAVAERPDGSRVPFIPYPTPLFDDAGTLIGAVNMLVDISDRKKAEVALQQLNDTLEQRVEARTQQVRETFTKLYESERRFRLLVDGVVDYAIFMLDPDGFVTNWNSGAQRIKGYSVNEIIGRHFSCFYTDEDRAKGLPEQVLQTALRNGRFETEGWRQRKDGSVFWASVVIDAIRDERGNLAGFAKVTRDLTERRTAEEQRRQAQKMEAIGQITGGVAHDFNNLLTAIIGNLEVLTAVLPAREPARRYIEAATRAAWRGSKMTEHLLAFSRRKAVQPEIVGINELIREMSLICQKTVGEGVELVIELQDDLWTCEIDAGQFEAAILNLAANARDAMERSGRLTIATENVTTGGDTVDLNAGDYVLLSVSDNGCGMSGEVLSHAFEPFYTTKDIGKGTGLGLSQVYGFAKQSGGSTHIESKAGIGTTIRIYLPRTDGEPLRPTASPEPLSAAPAGSATILVVEDDVEVREMTAAMLAHLGYRVLLAATGPEALAILRRDRTVGLLFSDIVMPAGMSGIDLARAACRLRPGLKVLLNSGYPGDEIKLHEIQTEFPFINKPYKSVTLGRKLADVLGEGQPLATRL